MMQDPDLDRMTDEALRALVERANAILARRQAEARPGTVTPHVTSGDRPIPGKRFGYGTRG